MKKITRSWLERHAGLAEGEMPLAGTGSLAVFRTRVGQAERAAAQITPAHAMAVVIKAACEQEGLDKQKLADRAGLSKDDVEGMFEAAVQPSMRIVAGLSKALHLSRGKLATIAGLGLLRDAQNDPVMVRYATLSRGLATLDDGGRELLADFIKFMSEE